MPVDPEDYSGYAGDLDDDEAEAGMRAYVSRLWAEDWDEGEDY